MEFVVIVPKLVKNVDFCLPRLYDTPNKRQKKHFAPRVAGLPRNATFYAKPFTNYRLSSTEKFDSLETFVTRYGELCAAPTGCMTSSAMRR